MIGKAPYESTLQRIANPSEAEPPLPVSLAPLDHVFPSGMNGRLGMVKIDAQGYECRVLKGGARLLREARLVVAESDKNLLKMQGCSSERLRSRLAHDFDVKEIQQSYVEATFIGRRRSGWMRRKSVRRSGVRALV